MAVLLSERGLRFGAGLSSWVIDFDRVARVMEQRNVGRPVGIAAAAAVAVLIYRLSEQMGWSRTRTPVSFAATLLDNFTVAHWAAPERAPSD